MGLALNVTILHLLALWCYITFLLTSAFSKFSPRYLKNNGSNFGFGNFNEQSSYEIFCPSLTHSVTKLVTCSVTQSNNWCNHIYFCLYICTKHFILYVQEVVTLQKKYLIYLHQKIRLTPFIKYYDTLG